MLNPEALVDRGAAVIPMDRHRDDDRPFGQQQPVALVRRDVEMVGDDMELIARHGEDRSGKERHRRVPSLRRWFAPGEAIFVPRPAAVKSADWPS